MPKQTAETDQDPARQKIERPAPLQSSAAALEAQQPAGLPPVAAGSLQRQAGQLGDSRLATIQRQALAAQIGQVQGNRHLARVVASLNPAQEAAGSLQRKPAEEPAAAETQAAQGPAEAQEPAAPKSKQGFFSKAWSGVKSTFKAIGNFFYTGEYKDLNTAQFRVLSGKVQVVKRMQRQDGSVGYTAVGEVKSFDHNRPNITYYDQPQDLGDWYPRVTHINGMNVKPEDGIESAQALQSALRAELAEKGEVTLEPDVLYTYSATRGMGRDVIECITGKLGMEDDATRAQETIMLDAVHNKHRTTVSAHSRGTIKTDNAVHNAFKVLGKEYVPQTLKSPEAEQAAVEARQHLASMERSGEAQLDPALVEDIARRAKARELADQMAATAMDQYIQLIYAGNAVEFPSKVLKVSLVVGRSDPVTILFGKYFKLLSSKASVSKVPGGHSFDQVYADHVAELIVADMAGAH